MFNSSIIHCKDIPKKAINPPNKMNDIELNTISEKPDLILYSGDYTFEGRNYSTDEESYFFKNHDFYYQVWLYNSESETIGYDAKLSVWKGKPYVNENIIVEQNGQIISPFSKVLSSKNAFNLVNNLPSSEFLSNLVEAFESSEHFRLIGGNGPRGTPVLEILLCFPP